MYGAGSASGADVSRAGVASDSERWVGPWPGRLSVERQGRDRMSLTSRVRLMLPCTHPFARSNAPVVGRYSSEGGGGGSIEPPKTGGGGVGKRAQLTGPLISDYEVWRQRRPKIFLPLKMVNSFPHQMHGK